jgi:hypothetical protein
MSENLVFKENLKCGVQDKSYREEEEKKKKDNVQINIHKTFI